MDGDEGPVWTIGSLARRTGLTTRTLRHYDRIGLLAPKDRSAGGQRIYGLNEVIRLERIVSLKRLGLPLRKIGTLLDRGTGSLVAAIEDQLTQVRRQIEWATALRDKLEGVSAALEARGEVDAEALLEIMEVMQMVEKHGFEPGFSEDERAKIKASAEALGPQGIEAAEREWPALIEAMAAAMEAGKAEGDFEVRELARRWCELIDQFSGGDADIERKLAEAYRRSPDFGAQFGLTAELMAYVGRAMALLQE